MMRADYPGHDNASCYSMPCCQRLPCVIYIYMMPAIRQYHDDAIITLLLCIMMPTAALWHDMLTATSTILCTSAAVKYFYDFFCLVLWCPAAVMCYDFCWYFPWCQRSVYAILPTSVKFCDSNCCKHCLLLALLSPRRSTAVTDHNLSCCPILQCQLLSSSHNSMNLAVVKYYKASLCQLLWCQLPTCCLM